MYLDVTCRLYVGPVLIPEFWIVGSITGRASTIQAVSDQHVEFSSMLLLVQGLAVRDGEPRTATSTSTQLLSCNMSGSVQCCFTSTETIRTIREGEPRTSTSTFTQLLGSDALSLQCCFTST